MTAIIPPVTTADHSLGTESSVVTIVMYGDYAEPASVAANRAVSTLREAADDRVRTVWRHFPQPTIHPNAVAAALTAEVAHRYGMFWEMHTLLLQAQDALCLPDLQTYAAMIGLPPQAIREGFADPALRIQVRHQLAQGIQAGVLSAPALFVNGEPLTKGWEHGRLDAAVMQALGARGVTLNPTTISP